MIDYSKYRFTNAVLWLLQHLTPVSWIISAIGYAKCKKYLQIIENFNKKEFLIDTDSTVDCDSLAFNIHNINAGIADSKNRAVKKAFLNYTNTNGDHEICSRGFNILCLNAALAAGMAIAYKQHIVNLATAISIPITFFAVTLIFCTLGFCISYAKRGEQLVALTNTQQHTNDDHYKVIEHADFQALIENKDKILSCKKNALNDVFLFHPAFTALLLVTMPVDFVVNKVTECFSSKQQGYQQV